MVAYFYQDDGRWLFPRYETVHPWGVPVLKVGLPLRLSVRRRRRLAQRLYDRGLRRFLPGERMGDMSPLSAVDPLPLCRAKGAELVLALLPGVGARERRVALRGEKADAVAWALGAALCPQVGALLLDFDRGEEELARQLRDRYGAAPLHLGQGPEPMAALELSPRPTPLPKTLALWGELELGGYSLTIEEPLPAEFAPLPFLELLWETGRVGLEQITVTRGAEWP